MTHAEFQLFVKQYEKLVFTICYQLVKDRGEAENLTQDTFLAAYTHIDNVKPETRRPYLCKIAVNKARDYLKSAYARRVRPAEPEELVAAGTAPSAEDIFLERQEREILESYVFSLKEPYRKVSEFYFLEGKSIPEIAYLLDRPEKTVKTQLYRAKGQLRQFAGKEAGP